MKAKRQNFLLRTTNRWLPILILVALSSVWEVLARTGHLSLIFFPAPSSILKTLWQLLVDGRLLDNLLVTLARIGYGVIFGFVPGVVIGLAMGWSPDLRKILDPFVAAIHPLPKIAIFPLIMILFGIGESSKIVAISISTFFPILINSMAGVIQLNPVYFEVAKNYGANRWNTFTHIVFPGSLPMILAGARIAFNMALVITIAVELLTARSGLGVLIWFAWETLRTEDLYATLIVIALLGIAINFLLHKASVLLTPWHSQTPSERI